MSWWLCGTDLIVFYVITYLSTNAWPNACKLSGLGVRASEIIPRSIFILLDSFVAGLCSCARFHALIYHSCTYHVSSDRDGV